MDTISRENNSMLPVGAMIVGAIGLLLGGFGLVQASKANKSIEALQPRVEKIDAIEGQVTSASASAEKAAKDVAALQRSTQTAFDSVGPLLGSLQASVTKLEEAAKKPVAAAPPGKKGASGPAVTGPGEYIVKPGDTGMKIANANKVSIGDLQTVNPGVNWSGLKVGQKLKLPAKK